MASTSGNAGADNSMNHTLANVSSNDASNSEPRDLVLAREEYMRAREQQQHFAAASSGDDSQEPLDLQRPWEKMRDREVDENGKERPQSSDGNAYNQPTASSEVHHGETAYPPPPKSYEDRPPVNESSSSDHNKMQPSAEADQPSTSEAARPSSSSSSGAVKPAAEMQEHEQAIRDMEAASSAQDFNRPAADASSSKGDGGDNIDQNPDEDEDDDNEVENEEEDSDGGQEMMDPSDIKPDLAEGDVVFESDEDPLPRIQPILDKLNLTTFQLEDWIIVHRARFDTRVLDEPHIAIQAYVHFDSKTFLFRVWGRTKLSCTFSSMNDLTDLLQQSFDGTVACIGLNLDADDVLSEEPFYKVPIPFDRKMSADCVMAYNIRDTVEPNKFEMEGAGVCQACISVCSVKDDLAVEEAYADTFGAAGNNSGFNSAVKKEVMDDEDFYPEQSMETYDDDDDGDYKPVPKMRLKPGPKKGEKRKTSPKKPGGPKVSRGPRIERQDTYHCTSCVLTYKQLSGYRTHNRNVHGYGLYSCKHCGEEEEAKKKQFNWPGVYFGHHFEMHKDLDFVCPICDTVHFKGHQATEFVTHLVKCKRDKKNMNEAQRRLDNPPAFMCDTCGSAFRSPGVLADHKNMHLGLKPYKCDECDFASPFKTSLCIHRRIHARKRGDIISKRGRNINFPCVPCKRTFSSKESHTLHYETVHLGIKKEYPCPTCDEVFQSKTGKRMHMIREHNREKAQYCSICNSMFPTKAGLRTHMDSHMAPKFFCRYCGKGLKKKQALVAHERQHTGENPISCDMCDYTCKCTTVLRKHKIARHGVP